MFQWDAIATIVVPVDLDEPDIDAFQVAIAARPGVLHIVYVLSELEPSLMTQIDPMHRQESALHGLETWIREQGAPMSTRAHVRIGTPGQVVPALVREVGADLVIMSCHGRTGIRRALMGSVSERLVRLSPCPVLVLKSGAT